MTQQFDEINKAAHYNQSPAKCTKCGHPIECIDIVKFYGFCIGNAIKYLWRFTLKDPSDLTKDLKKSIYYIEKEIKEIESRTAITIPPAQKKTEKYSTQQGYDHE